MKRDQTTHSLPGPDDITRVQLANGITVLARANFNSPSVAVSGYLTAGGLFDEPEKAGLAGFTAAALLRGTQQRGFQEIYELLESSGASLGYNGGTHTTGFGGKALAEDLTSLLELLGETLRQPLFPPDQVERLRAQVLTSLAIRAQDTGEMAGLAFDELVYAGHPYSRSDDGYPETIQAIQREDLVAFHRRHYGPRGLVVAIVGAAEPQAAVALVDSLLGAWANPTQPEPAALPEVAPLAGLAQRKVEIAGKSQADIVIGAAGPARRSPDFLAAALGNSVLGQFGMMGRIGKNVREEAGLAYYAYSSLSGGSGPGPWSVSAGVDPANVEAAVGLVREEIDRFTREPITATELQDNQSNFIGRLPLSLEANSGVAGALINLEHYDLGLDYYRRYPGLVRAVTAEQILEAARSYLDPDRLGISVAGP